MASPITGCYVPGCDEQAEKEGDLERLVFEAPTSAVRVQKWKGSLPKGPKPFNQYTDGVCVKHFEDKYLRKEEIINVCGIQERFPIDPWELTEDAVPTIFDDVSVPASTATEPTPAEQDIKSEGGDVQMDTVKEDTSQAQLNGSASKRKVELLEKPGPLSKKLKQVSRKSTGKPPGSTENSINDSDEDVVTGRPAHLKREIVPPQRIRDSITSDDEDNDYTDQNYEPDEASPSPPSPSSSKPKPMPKSKQPFKPTVGPASKKSGVDVPQILGKCFIVTCTRNPYATLFKIPQMTKNKLKDWVRYIPTTAIPSGVAFDPRIHLLCEEHFDKKFIMNTPNGKILTGDAVPSIFPKFVTGPLPGVKSRSAPTPPVKQRGSKSRIEIVDGYEIEYEDDIGADPDFTPSRNKRKPPPKTRDPVTVTIDDEDEANKVKHSHLPKKASPKAKGRILELKDPGYNLQYIYDSKDRIQLPQADIWLFQMLTDKETRAKIIFIAEIVGRNERLIFRRSIKIRQDLTFKVEANGADFTQMFNEAGDKVDSLYKLQEMILDLSAFKVCEGWANYDSIEACSIGRKIEGVWFARNCEGLNLNNTRCRPCLTLKQSLLARKNGLALIADPNVVQQIRKLPKDDPLHLQLQVQDLVKERTKLKYDISTGEKREARLQEKLNVYEGGKPKTIAGGTSATTPTLPIRSVGPGTSSTFAPRARMTRPRAPVPTGTPRATVPLNVPLTRPVAPVPSGPTIVTTSPISTQGVAAPINITTIPQEFQEFLSTPTFVLAQGSGIIGHQPVEAGQQVVPGAHLPADNIPVQKSQSGFDGQGGHPDQITLLSL